MSALTPSAIQDAIVAALTARYPTFTVEAHGGLFTERELPFLLNKAPALLVACTRFSALHVHQDLDHWQASLGFAVYVFGLDSSTVDRADQSVDTVFDLLKWLPQQRWGLSESRLIDEATISADNLYTGQVNLLRVAVWGVTWTQAFQTLHLP